MREAKEKKQLKKGKLPEGVKVEEKPKKKTVGFA
jgi:hypothetical protein